MYCSKCGAKIPEGSGFCTSCGTRVSGEYSNVLDAASQWVKTDLVAALVTLGAIMVMIGAFLSWMSVAVYGGASSTLGINMSNGAVVLMGAVLSLSSLVLARSGATGRWSAVMLLLSALMLALVFQAMYLIRNNHENIGAGLYVAMVGALAITAGSIREFVPRKKSSVKGSETISPGSPSIEDELKKLKELYDSGALTAAEYEEQKKRLLQKL